MLAHDVVAGPASSAEANRSDDVVVFAHGILGSRANWKSFAKKLVEAAPTQKALLVDLRHHGDSHGAEFAAPETIEACAKDVDATCRQLGLRPRVVVGHSFGGKVMLQLSLVDPAVAVAVIVDCPPGRRSFGAGKTQPRIEEIDRVLAAVAEVPLPVTSRKDLVTALRDRGLSEPIAQWMTTNLNAQMRWKFDLDAIAPLLASFGALDLWPALWAHRNDLSVHFVRGGRSDRWSKAEEENVKEAADKGVVVDHVVDNAGHWVHTDDPQALLSIVLACL